MAQKETHETYIFKHHWFLLVWLLASFRKGSILKGTQKDRFVNANLRNCYCSDEKSFLMKDLIICTRFWHVSTHSATGFFPKHVSKKTYVLYRFSGSTAYLTTIPGAQSYPTGIAHLLFANSTRRVRTWPGQPHGNGSREFTSNATPALPESKALWTDDLKNHGGY